MLAFFFTFSAFFFDAFQNEARISSFVTTDLKPDAVVEANKNWSGASYRQIIGRLESEIEQWIKVDKIDRATNALNQEGRYKLLLGDFKEALAVALKSENISVKSGIDR